MPNVTVTITHSLASQPARHLVGTWPSRRIAITQFSRTATAGQPRLKTVCHVYSGTPIQTEITPAIAVLDSLNVPCLVRVNTGNPTLVERPGISLNMNRQCWCVLARAPPATASRTHSPSAPESRPAEPISHSETPD